LEFIKARSVVTDMPYTCCFCAKTAYCFSEGSSCCRSCIKAKKPCDSVLVASTQVDESDALESALDAYKRGIVEELQFIQVPNNVD
ncbi:hypothetical protein CI238_05138, partial [Colletotrichum incanum]